MHLEHLWSSYILTKDVKNFMKTKKLLRNQTKTKEKTFQQGEPEKLTEHFWQ